MFIVFTIGLLSILHVMCCSSCGANWGLFLFCITLNMLCIFKVKDSASLHLLGFFKSCCWAELWYAKFQPEAKFYIWVKNTQINPTGIVSHIIICRKRNFAREREREALLKMSLKSASFHFFIFVLLSTLPWRSRSNALRSNRCSPDLYSFMFPFIFLPRFYWKF